MKKGRRSLVDPDSYLGTTILVGTGVVHANMPAASAKGHRRRLARGAVGDFVFIDCELVKILGRIVEVKVPESERLDLEPSLGERPEPHPVGKIQLFSTIDAVSHDLRRGITSYPRVGDGVFLADSEALAEMIMQVTSSSEDVSIEVGSFDAGSELTFRLSPEKLFGRHCGILGSTGGGKSWTIATLLHQIAQHNGKAIVFDPTGEFSSVSAIDTHFSFSVKEDAAELVRFPYKLTTEDDLFALLRPSGQSQGPRLRDAIKSQKLAAVIASSVPAGITLENGVIIKRQRQRKAFYDALDAHSQAVHATECQFEVGKLADQLVNECVWSTDRNDPSKWGLPDEGALSYCEQLISRIRTVTNSPELACLFSENGKPFSEVMDEFLVNDKKSVLRISFRNVRFEHGTREILMNVIGRYMLGQARQDKFRRNPLIVVLDEAHQYLGRSIGDDNNAVKLDAFGLIAKEGRKYGLSVVLATQRPRDIPQDVLSQLGTLIVHRLTNDQDRETVERACGDLDRNAAAFIPTLSPGEAIVIGPDIPAPVPIRMSVPTSRPNSQGPKFSESWRERAKK
jgi:DNA helicase HerA-like ATPase